ncbi:hypothetical protein H2200_007210 [Cladophialophora chaetospira]|uniref:Uncharacterized protein n=1 Tax=Cladophialophora chaetospira TaxID=386627 RepID=A0AA38X7E3_9EURO|nr:hypothetical protein H2200_007210 [Cladophialophora chaetospira]
MAGSTKTFDSALHAMASPFSWIFGIITKRTPNRDPVIQFAKVSYAPHGPSTLQRTDQRPGSGRKSRRTAHADLAFEPRRLPKTLPIVTRQTTIKKSSHKGLTASETSSTPTQAERKIGSKDGGGHHYAGRDGELNFH